MVNARQQIPEDVEKAKAYDNAVNGSPAPVEQNMTIYDLMEQYGVTPEDIQVVANEHPEMAQMIGGGKTLEEYARSADRKTGIAKGLCGSGTNEIMANANVDKVDTCLNNRARAELLSNTLKKPGAKPTTAGAVRYLGLETTGSWISIDFKNQAYEIGKPRSCTDDMNRFSYGVKPGVVISIDYIADPGVRKAKAVKPEDKKNGGTAGGWYGHVAVKGTDGRFHCDGAQQSMNFARYGKQYHLSYPTDAVVPTEYCNMIVDQAKTRQSDPNYRYPDDVRKRTTPQGGYRRPAPQKQAGRQQSRSNNNSGTNRSGRRSGSASRDRGGR